MDYAKVWTIDKLVKKLHKANENRPDYATAFSTDWRAQYLVETRKSIIEKNAHKKNAMPNDFNEDSDGASKTLKTSTECKIDITTLFKSISGDTKNNDLRIGDIANDFLSIFKLVNAQTVFSIEIDIEMLNGFIVKYCYPPVSMETEDRTRPKKTPVIICDAEGIRKDFSRCGYEKTITTYYPIGSEIVDYVSALGQMFSPLSDARFGDGHLSFGVNFITHYSHKGKNSNVSLVIAEDAINSIILFDASRAIGRYALKLCPICSKFFFQNRKQKCCIHCKPISKMTKSEMASNPVKSDNVSNDYDRLRVYKQLTRIKPPLSREEISKRLVEQGFKGLARKRKGGARK